MTGCHPRTPVKLVVTYNGSTYNYTCITNKTIKIKNGNIGNGKGLRIITWNKDKAHLVNRMDTIRQLIEDEQPHILALHEANIMQGNDLEELQIPEYNLITDGLYRAGRTGRTCMYVSTSLRADVRVELMEPDLALIALSLGKPHQKRFNVLSFYRQWTVLDNDEPRQTQ